MKKYMAILPWISSSQLEFYLHSNVALATEASNTSSSHTTLELLILSDRLMLSRLQVDPFMHTLQDPQ